MGDFFGALASLSLGFLSWFFLGGDWTETGSFRRRARFWLVARLGAALTLGLVAYTALQSAAALAAYAVFAGLSMVWFVRRRMAHAELFAVASGPPGAALAPSRGAPPLRLFPWYALRVLAIAVDAARRGDVEPARRALDDLDPDELTPGELRFANAARALVARRWGDPKESVRRALAAFPTGALALDEELARITIADAWHDANRLATLAAAWDEAGAWSAETTAIGRLRHLIELKLERPAPSELSAAATSSLAEEAQSLGDAALVAKLAEPPASAGYR